MRRDVLDGIAGIQARLKDLNPLAGNLRPTHPPDHLFGLAAEHAAAYNLDVSLSFCFHVRCSVQIKRGQMLTPAPLARDTFS
jgi:hypothetical protein